jgi:hypothetical protein
MLTATGSDAVVLRGGLLVSIEALRLLWDFEARGCIVRCEPDGALFVGPRLALTDDDAAAIRQHRDELIALVAYCEAVQ